MTFSHLLLKNYLIRSWRDARVFYGSCIPPTKASKEDPTILLKTDNTLGEKAPEGPSLQGKMLGVLSGVWYDHNKFEMTPYTTSLDAESQGKISKYLSQISCNMNVGKAFVLPETLPGKLLSLYSIGSKKAGYNGLEELDQYRENVRCGTAAGMISLAPYRSKISKYYIDNCEADDAAAEGTNLAAWSLGPDFGQTDSGIFEASDQKASSLGKPSCEPWINGYYRADAQNWARHLTEMPSNKMQPTTLAQAAKQKLQPLNIKIEVHERDWIEKNGMHAFLKVADGSKGKPVFIECVYDGNGDSKPTVLLTASGVTFDSGGLCLRKPESMVEQPGSMAGAAVALATLTALKRLGVKLNVRCIIPVCENMISGACMTVGDSVTLQNQNIEVARTDLESHLMLADALIYGQAKYKPGLIVNVATLTHSVERATGGGAFGCYTNDEQYWQWMKLAGIVSGDRPWRLPAWKYYLAQLNNMGKYMANDGTDKSLTCLGAAFLKAFIKGNFVHLDITGVTKTPDAILPTYLDRRYATGRPTRTLIYFLQNVAAGDPSPP